MLRPGLAARLDREAREREQAVQDANEAADLRRLHEFSRRLLSIRGLQPLFEEVLDAMIGLHGADFGVAHRVERERGDPVAVAQRGLSEEFLGYFARTHDDGMSCSRALRSGERVIVEDVIADPGYAPHRAIVEVSGFRAVQSTPLISHTGELLGIITTHFRQPHTFSQGVLRCTDLYARYAVDIIERNWAEDKLRAGEERFRRYFDLGLIGMALTKPDTGCIEVNDELCRILGYSRDELLRIRWPDITHPEDLAADRAQFEQVLAGEQDGYLLDKRFIHKDGRPIYCTMAVKCLRTSNGLVDCFVALVQDISERREAGDALRRARDEPAHVARVAAMGELAASIAHAMNQPLAAIETNGHAAVRWLAMRPPNLGEAVVAIERIVADAHRAGEAIARIRAFVQRGETRRSQVQLHGLLREVADMVESEARARGIELDIEPEHPVLAPVIGDRVQLQQVVLNLVLNGIEAMATTPAPLRRLRMEVRQDGLQMQRVLVRDAGVGLHPDERDHVFDAFYSSKPSGMGMGLAISRSIVEAHEGRLWCSANEEGGETFSFTLPV
ncbi:sensor histidine kinase [Variovorax ginsengisoli]|uniref:histidine kinase n=1 Tax=Variovorax ginsengisoli TaxID=363844 RepID=A0ABT8SEM2_9BURK|nr:ATP-binding protein [Variovorax ginsengisoli]MDN8618060.1 PAS domain S-box protein [Variovorax ginsengisoli]MDO1537230.1 PAS domain S-box protein [Variovorax ginsengisoli]